MSYGLKYTLNFRDTILPAATWWAVNIYSNGYVGSSAIILGADSPVSISYKKQSLLAAINGSECTFSIQATSAGQYDEFLTAAPLQYYIQIKRSTDGITYSPYWYGVNTTDTLSEASSNPPYIMNLKFNCGLGELQFHRYEQGGNLFESYEQIVQIFNNCFAFLPYTLNLREIINIREDTMSDVLGLLQQTYLDDAAFYEIGDDQLTHGMNCQKVLNLICTALNCRVYQSNGKWFVERIYERTTITPTYFDYTLGATQVTTNAISASSTGGLSWGNTINNASFPKLLSTTEKLITTKNSSTLYNLQTTAYNNDQLIPNPFFEDTPNSKDVNGYPLRWDRSSAIAGLGGDGIKLVSPYDPDPKYRWAYDFGSTVQAHNATTLSNTYNLHATLRSGDTYTRPWVFIDTVNGSLQVNIQLFIEVTINPASNFTKTTAFGTLVGNALFNNLLIYPTFKLQFKNGSNIYSVYSTATNDWTTPTTVAGDKQFIGQISLAELCTNFYYPNDNLTQVPIAASRLGSMCLGNIGGSFTLKFRYSKSFNIPLAGLSHGSDIYSFNAYCYPAWYDKNALASLGLKIQSWSFPAYGVNAIDCQYKDNFLSATPYSVFYASPDVNNRWKELKVNVQLGDSLTPGYPGSFRVAGGQQTTTWHEMPYGGYVLSGSHSAGDPGAGEIAFNNATLASITHIYVNINGNQAFLSSIIAGNKIVINDIDNTSNIVFTAGTPVAHSTYYDIPVTYVSESGVFTTGDTLTIKNGGIILADILFKKFAQIPANYRINLKGHISDNSIYYFNSIIDEDGIVYIQLEHTYDIKNGTYQTDMEQMADLFLAVAVTRGSGVSVLSTPTSSAVALSISTPMRSATTTPISVSASITSSPSYPL